MTKQDKKEGASAAASPHTDQLLSQVPTFLSSAHLSLHTRSLHQAR
jgi:hypothetical protein